MKKLTAVLCMVIALTFALAGCGADYSDSKHVGTWKATKCEYSGFELEIASVIGGDFTITLESNGKCKADIAGEKATGKWTETEDGIELDNSIKLDSSEGLVFKDNEGKLDLEMSGMILHFEKQE